MNPPDEAVTFLYMVQAQPGKEDALAELLRLLVTKSRYEPGNMIYETYEVTNRAGIYVVYSVWLSQQALDAHHATAPVRDAIARFSSLAQGEFGDGAHLLRKLLPEI